MDFFRVTGFTIVGVICVSMGLGEWGIALPKLRKLGCIVGSDGGWPGEGSLARIAVISELPLSATDLGPQYPVLFRPEPSNAAQQTS
jgi:hypothetical protein